MFVTRLLVRPGAVGDSLLGFPALEWLRAGFTEVWVRTEIVPLVGFADSVRSIAGAGIDLLGVEGVEPPDALVRALGAFDQVFSWYGANRPEFRAALTAICPDSTFFPALPRPAAGLHAADFFMTQVGGPLPAVPRVSVGPVERRGGVVVHPYSGSPGKNWPLERFQELERGFPVEWAAGPDGYRFDDLMDLARWIAGADLFVGNDSGITHLAAAVGTPVVALFGPTDPDVWGPRGERVSVVRARSMGEISSSTVRLAMDRLLGRTGPG